MIKFRNVHCRYTVKRSAFFFLNALKNNKRIKTFKKNMRCSMRKNCHYSKHNTETMEQRYRKTYSFIISITHTFTDTETVVYYVYDNMHADTSAAAAAAVFLFIIILLFTFFQFKVSNKRVHY